MENNKMRQKAKLVIQTTLETGWAIGTSIAASAAPSKYALRFSNLSSLNITHIFNRDRYTFT